MAGTATLAAPSATRPKTSTAYRRRWRTTTPSASGSRRLGIGSSGLFSGPKGAFFKGSELTDENHSIGCLSQERAMTLAVLDQHIEATPGICGGKPRIAGHRITVHHVAIWHERVGMRPDEIASQYELSLGDVYAALTYYHDHREEIDRQIEEGEAFAEAMREQAPSVLEEELSNEQRATLDAEVDRKVSAWEAKRARSERAE